MKLQKYARPLGILAFCSIAAAPSLPSASREGYSVTLGASVEPKRIPLNRTAALTVRLSWEGALDSLVIGEVEEPVLTNLEVAGTSTSNRVEGTATGSRSVKEIAYTLKPKSLGMGYIDSIRVSYEDRRSGVVHLVKTQRLSAEAVDPVPESRGGSRAWLWTLLIVCFIAGALGGAAFFLKSKTRKPLETAPPPGPAEETYLESLKAVRGANAENPPEALVPLSKLFRRYLSEKFGIPALEATTRELLGALRNSGVEEGLIKKCEAFFEKADVIKFSGRKASQAEFDAAYTTVESVLESKLTEERKRIQDLREAALKEADQKGNRFRRLIRRNS
jgi:hypothetical protein